MQIAVTQKHIDAGRRCYAEACPVALALRECLHDDRIAVGHTRWVSLGCADGNPLPRDVGNRIRQYDQTGVMVPFTFTIRKPR